MGSIFKGGQNRDCQPATAQRGGRLESIGKLLLATTMTAAAVAVTLIAPPAPSAQAVEGADCKDVTIIGARGSTEASDSGGSIQAGFGDTVGPAAGRIIQGLVTAENPKSYKTIDVKYPAADPNERVSGGKRKIETGDYDNSVKAGVNFVVNKVMEEVGSCQDTAIILMGYSQGAQVVHEATLRISSTYAEHIANVVLISDTTVNHNIESEPLTYDESGFISGAPDDRPFDHNLGFMHKAQSSGFYPADRKIGGAFPSHFQGKVVEVCHSQDPVCGYPTPPSGLELAATLGSGISLWCSPLDGSSWTWNNDAFECGGTHGTWYRTHTWVFDQPADRVMFSLDHHTPPASTAERSVMKSVWDTRIGGCQTITLPIRGAISDTIDWGDGSALDTTSKSFPSHTYPAGSGLVNITVNGQFEKWGTQYLYDAWSKQCIIRVTEWEETGTTDLSVAFGQATNLKSVARIPSTVTNLDYAFWKAQSLESNSLSGLDTSSVTSMASTFSGVGSTGAFAVPLNLGISGWDTSNVKNFNSTFSDSNVSDSVSSWNTSQATSMSSMFQGSKFNGDVSQWDTSQVTNMSNMFWGTPFTGGSSIGGLGGISGWNTSNVTSMGGMFAYTPFNGNISAWDVSKVYSMNSMFTNTPFNQDISGWNTPSLEAIASAFENTPFNQDISGWDTSKVYNFNSTFNGNSAFNKDLSGWNTDSFLYHSSFAPNLNPSYQPTFTPREVCDWDMNWDTEEMEWMCKTIS